MTTPIPLNLIDSAKSDTGGSSTRRWLAQFFRYFNHVMIVMWRLGLGRWVNFWPAVVGQIMVITHQGRKSGLLRRTPVNYTVVNGNVYCIAGFGSGSDWYRNLVSNPHVEIWLPDGRWSGVAEVVGDHAFNLSLIRQVLIDSGFAAYAAGINPYRITDAALNTATAHYPLIRIGNLTALSKQGGPGDLAWAWPVLGVLVLVCLIGLRHSLSGHAKHSSARRSRQMFNDR